MVVDTSETSPLNSDKPSHDLLEHSPVGLMQVNHEGIVLSLNSYCADIFGYSKEELLAQPFDILIPTAMRKGHTSLFRNFLENDQSRMMGQGTEKRFFPALHRSGETIYVQIGLNINREGVNTVLTLAVSDVTDKANMLKELREGNQRLQEKTRELTQLVRQQNHFLNVVSHELRTPLSNSLETLNQLSATDLSEDQAELFKDLDRANIDVTRSVKMLMDYADSMLGELALDEEEFDLRALWLDRLRMVQRSHPDQIQLVNIREEFDFDPLILTDKIRLGRMMHGLVDNAMKFANATKVNVEIVFRAEPEPHLYFEVTDNGKGMPESLVDRVGKPFGNREERRSRGGGGMGVGFYLTRKYLDMMHGQFFLKSKLGQGTKAGFQIPLKMTGMAASQSVSSHSGISDLPLNNLKLLLVEDDPTVSKINSILLRKLGAQVITAGNGQVAVDMLKGSHLEVGAILMDLHMPVMDGFSATRHIRQIECHSKTPIVAVTAGSRLAEYARAMAAGIDVFYSKPFEPGLLVHYLKARGLIH